MAPLVARPRPLAAGDWGLVNPRLSAAFSFALSARFIVVGADEAADEAAAQTVRECRVASRARSQVELILLVLFARELQSLLLWQHR